MKANSKQKILVTVSIIYGITFTLIFGVIFYWLNRTESIKHYLKTNYPSLKFSNIELKSDGNYIDSSDLGNGNLKCSEETIKYKNYLVHSDTDNIDFYVSYNYITTDPLGIVFIKGFKFSEACSQKNLCSKFIEKRGCSEYMDSGYRDNYQIIKELYNYINTEFGNDFAKIDIYDEVNESNVFDNIITRLNINYSADDIIKEENSTKIKLLIKKWLEIVITNSNSIYFNSNPINKDSISILTSDKKIEIKYENSYKNYNYCADDEYQQYKEIFEFNENEI